MLAIIHMWVWEEPSFLGVSLPFSSSSSLPVSLHLSKFLRYLRSINPVGRGRGAWCIWGFYIILCPWRYIMLFSSIEWVVNPSHEPVLSINVLMHSLWRCFYICVVYSCSCVCFPYIGQGVQQVEGLQEDTLKSRESETVCETRGQRRTQLTPSPLL